jgi:predicted CxxxxCH...CXXCH cytochrome family protein
MKTCVVALLGVALAGCSTGNDQAPALSSTGKHPVDWQAKHRAVYRQSPEQCKECHGNDLKGGLVKVDCFNQAALGQCHANGHGPRSIIHPVPFKGTTDLNKQHGALAKQDLTICQDCHGTIGGAGSNPRFTAVYGSLPVGCESSGCHRVNMAHPKPWSSHDTAGNQANACALCHGTSYGGGSGPACSSCHSLLLAGTIPVVGQCTSCHGNAPNSTAPSFSGSHAKHLALPELKANCGACHSGGGNGSVVHVSYNAARSAVVGIDNVFTAKTGSVPTYSGSAGSCANISCHGGQTTPAWGGQLGGCASCHTGSGQYNSYVSGKHNTHISQGLACTDCHDTTRLAPGHFSNLSSATLNQPAAGTLRSYLNYNQQTCTPGTVPAGIAVTVCHAGLPLQNKPIQQPWN